MRRLQVREGVADDETCGPVRIGEVAEGFLEEACLRFAALAFVLIVRTVIERIDVGAGRGEVLLQTSMKVLDVGAGGSTQGNAALVGNNDDAYPRAIEGGDGFFDPGEKVKILPAGDVFAFRRLAIDDAIAVEKHGTDTLKRSGHGPRFSRYSQDGDDGMIAEKLVMNCGPGRERGAMAEPPDSSLIFEAALAEHLAAVESLRSQRAVLEEIAQRMTHAVLEGNTVLWCGNGGSAADSQHLAAEFVGRFRRERRGLPSIALTTDTSVLTSVANDYGFDQVFRRQVEALCAPGDVLVGISTSGNSRNVCLALQAARERGAWTVGLTGQGGGAMAGVADAVLAVASKDTARIQEAHILCGHMLCDWIERSICAREGNMPGLKRP